MENMETTPAASPLVPPTTPSAGPPPADPGLAQQRGLSLQTKITLLLILVLVLFALTTAVFTALSLRTTLRAQYQSTGLVIAKGLAAAAVDLILNRDASTLQARVDELANTPGVAYVLLTSADQEVLAHTFAPFIPTDLPPNRVAAMDPSRIVEDLRFIDPANQRTRRIIDVAVPILANQLGAVRVGMDLDLINATIQAALLRLGLILLFAVAVAILVGYLAARQTIRPIAALVKVAQRVGRGDLTELAAVTSRDEIGVLAATFNDSIRRLREQVQTVEERDSERRQRETLQQNIAQFLDVATEIAGGNLTRRGRVTADILGAVVDSINLVVEEIGGTLREVKVAATTVNTGAQEMILATDEMVRGAQAQARDADQVNSQVAATAQAMRTVSTIAVSSAEAARTTRTAAERGQQSVVDTLSGMQGIRREVQGIARRIKSLGDRSLEISEVVATISSIAAQTNLLALNAAIEASGAGQEGARFAVVADEVRKLAEDSAKSAKSIGALIKSVQAEIQEAVIAMEEGTREVEKGFQVANQAGDRLQEIAQISAQSAGLAEQISTAAAEQVQGVERVANAVQSIAQIATRTEQSVLDGRRAAEQLLKLADDLNHALARFKLSA